MYVKNKTKIPPFHHKKFVRSPVFVSLSGMATHIMVSHQIGENPAMSMLIVRMMTTSFFLFVVHSLKWFPAAWRRYKFEEKYMPAGSKTPWCPTLSGLWLCLRDTADILLDRSRDKLAPKQRQKKKPCQKHLV
jgi:hypothetical protein